MKSDTNLFSAQLAFMVLSPMLDIKLDLMYLGVFAPIAYIFD